MQWDLGIFLGHIKLNRNQTQTHRQNYCQIKYNPFIISLFNIVTKWKLSIKS